MGDVQHEPIGPTRDHRYRRASRGWPACSIANRAVRAVRSACGDCDWGDRVLFTRHQAEAESLRAARNLTRVLAATLRPNLTDALLSREPSARRPSIPGPAAGARRAESYGSRSGAPAGPSSTPMSLGSSDRCIHEGGYRAALDSGSIDAEISDVSRPKNRFERGQGDPRVYMPVQTSTGHRLLFEPTSVWGRERERRASSVALTPALLAGLGLLWLIQLPMAWSLARRLRRHQDKQEQLLFARSTPQTWRDDHRIRSS